ncbi:MAG: outer membrane protein assembly factor BamA, partial [Bryobacteraceae bacterium]|nr:outer membrane protein assembly factor BamA [Bryobacteraceae bacterium]
MSHRLQSLPALILSVCCLQVWGQTSPTQVPAPKPPSQSTSQNPFETVPTSPQDPQPPAAAPQAPKPATGPAGQPVPPQTAPQLETPKPAPQEGVIAPENIVEGIEFRGSRRIPQETLRARIFTKKGDRYDDETLQRDFMALWNAGYFDDLRLEREAGPNGGWMIRFLVTERRMVRSIKYDGAKSVTVSEILDRFKERKVGLSVEQQYDPNRVQRASNVLREFLSERGRQYATVSPEIRQIPPSSLEVVFKVNEGPKVKVGNIEIEGNTVFTDRVVRRAMRNLRPVGLPRSILLENLFAKSFDRSKLDIDEEMIRNFYQEKGYFTARVIESSVAVRDVGGK